MANGPMVCGSLESMYFEKSTKGLAFRNPSGFLGSRLSGIALLKDYRELTGKFDKIVSIEMIEAVGHQYFDQYFGKCDELLKDSGMMLL